MFSQCPPVLFSHVHIASLSIEEELMRRLILAGLMAWLAVGTAAAQSCDSQAVSANGKPLHGAAKMSFVKSASGTPAQAKP